MTHAHNAAWRPQLVIRAGESSTSLAFFILGHELCYGIFCT